MTASGKATATAWPRRSARLAEAVLRDLIDRLAAGEFAAGSLLPAEPLLSAHYSVSRTTIREVVTRLQEKGLVSVKQGLGTTVAARDAWSLLDPIVMEQLIAHDSSLRYLDDLVKVRVALEGEMAAAAAARVTPDDVAAMHMLVKKMAAATDVEAFCEADLAFHHLIRTTSGNRLATSIVASIEAHALYSRQLQTAPSTADFSQANAGHQKIAEAISLCDGERAADEMRQHIGGSRLCHQAPRL